MRGCQLPTRRVAQLHGVFPEEQSPAAAGCEVNRANRILARQAKPVGRPAFARNDGLAPAFRKRTGRFVDARADRRSLGRGLGVFHDPPGHTLHRAPLRQKSVDRYAAPVHGAFGTTAAGPAVRRLAVVRARRNGDTRDVIAITADALPRCPREYPGAIAGVCGGRRAPCARNSAPGRRWMPCRRQGGANQGQATSRPAGSQRSAGLADRRHLVPSCRDDGTDRSGWRASASLGSGRQGLAGRPAAGRCGDLEAEPVGRQDRLVRLALPPCTAPMGPGMSRRSPASSVTLASRPRRPSARRRRRRIGRPASPPVCGPSVNTR